jgi:hypothetical protein
MAQLIDRDDIVKLFRDHAPAVKELSFFHQQNDQYVCEHVDKQMKLSM